MRFYTAEVFVSNTALLKTVAIFFVQKAGIDGL